MFGHPYAFGDGTSPVYVVGMLFEESFVKSLPNFSGPNQGGTSFKLYPLNFDLPPSTWPQFVRYLDEYDVQVPLNYNKAPDKNDVPYGSGFPKAGTEGSWTDPNDKANSTWNSKKIGTIDLDERLNGTRRDPMPIEFNNGYPDFTPWIIKDNNGNPITQ